MARGLFLGMSSDHFSKFFFWDGVGKPVPFLVILVVFERNGSVNKVSRDVNMELEMEQ